MAKVLIIYSTITGNTQLTADTIQHQLQPKWPQHVLEVMPAEAANLGLLQTLQPGDMCFLGASTWDGHTVSADMVNLMSQIETDQAVLKDKNWAVFGCGDSSYEPYFCHAVDILTEKLSTWGARLVVPSLKIDGFPELPANQAQIVAWCDQLSQAVG